MLKYELEFSNIGTTVVPEPTPYSAPENADVLTKALANMAALDNYTFKVSDVTTSAPSTLEASSTFPNSHLLKHSKNFPMAVLQ